METPQTQHDDPAESKDSPRRKRNPIALIALLLGILSIFLLFIPYGILGLIAMVLGIVALRQIRASGGETVGKGMAIFGIITGTLGLILGLAIFGLVQYQKTASLKVTPLDEAEKVLFAQPGDESGFGNTDEAASLARELAAEMKAFCEDTLEEKPFGISIMGDRHVAYCYLGKNRAGFLVMVPNLRKYSSPSKKMIGDRAWNRARELVRGAGLADNVEMAVALRGGLTYDGVYLGTIGGENPEKKDEQALQKFFAR